MQDHHHQHHQSLTAAAAAFPQLNAQFPEHEQLRCPRCDSANTKFCYYNNYNLSQPRHFCKSCRRYWTKGGTLRNIPVGGGCRKNSKRPAPASNSSKQQRTVQNSSALIPSSPGSGFEAIQKQSQTPSLKPEPAPTPETTRVGTGSGLPAESFTSLLGLTTPNVQFDNLLQGFTRHGPGSGPGQSLSEGFMMSGVQNGGNSHGWPDLAINTPGSKLQ